MNAKCNTSFCSLFVALLVTLSARFGLAQEPSIFDLMDDFRGVYSVSKQKGVQVPSTVIYDPYGKPRRDSGRLAHTGRLMKTPDGNLSVADSHLTNGRVWTPRVEEFLGLDLSKDSKIVDQPGFSNELLEKHPAIIEIVNGYAVNLYGATVRHNQVVDSGGEETYLTKAGKRLFGRLIVKEDQTKIVAGNKVVTTRRTALMEGTKVLATVERDIPLVADEVRDIWVGVTLHKDDRKLRGWILTRDLTRSAGQFEEIILKPGVVVPLMPKNPSSAPPVNGATKTEFDVIILEESP